MTWPTKTDFIDGDVLTAAQVNNIGTNLNEADPTGITDGYVLTADGAGSMGWEALPAGGGLTVITSGSLAGSSTVTLSSIPQTYKELYLYLDYVNVSDSVYMQMNGITTSLYYSQNSYIGGSSDATYSAQNKWRIRYQSSGSSTGIQVRFPNYSSTTTSAGYSSNVIGRASVSGETGAGSYAYVNDAITSLTILTSGVSFTNGTYTLYGVS